VLFRSQILQKVVQLEVRTQDPLAETDRYLADTVKEVGTPRSAHRSRFAAVTRRLARRAIPKGG
jgi:hypothetical protein